MSVQSNSPSAAGVLEYHAPDPSDPPSLRGGDVLACGFGMTAAVWIAAYLCRLPFMQAPGKVTVAAMLATIALGGFVAARYSIRGWACALWAGALSGFLDLLLVGALYKDFSQRAHEEVVPSAALWVIGSIVVNTLAASAGGFVGKFFPSKTRETIVWPHVFALILASLTLLLLAAGGLVTAFRAGLAVPDWPNSYGYNMFLFPLSMMQQESGRFYEHAHRLIASLVGFTALAIAIHSLLVEPRRWVKVFAWVIGFEVLAQAIMGGLRVTEINIVLAIAHGVFGQVVFASMAAYAAVTSRNFRLMPRVMRPEASNDRGLTVLLVVSVYIQLILGALLRHINSMLLLHITMATLVVLLALACGVRAWGLNGSLRPLLKSGLWVMGIVALQVTLGLIALVFRAQPGEQPSTVGAVITTIHQANGALLLAMAAVLMTWTWRLLLPGEKPADAAVAVSI